MIAEWANPAPVVVGVDDTGSSDHAVEWAAAEAATRASGLRIVHAYQSPTLADPYGLIPLVDTLSTARTAAESLLWDSLARARSVAPNIEMSARLLDGPAGPALLAEAEEARLLVLGSRGLRGLRALLAGTVSVQVATHSSCPVVVLRAREGGARGIEDGANSSPPRVVVGIDTRASCDLAVGFALEAARQRGVPVEAVHVLTPDPPADLEGIHGAPAVARAIATQALNRALRPWRARFPDVRVVTTLLGGDPAHELVNAARGAALLVIGSRGRTSLRATLLGSVDRSVLQHAHCPVAVVRSSSDTVPDTAAGAIAESNPGSAEGRPRGRWRGPGSRRRMF